MEAKAVCFTGKDDSEIEVKLRDWKHLMWGKIRNVREHPVADLPLQIRGRDSSHSPIGEIDDAHSMTVDYEEMEEESPPPAKRKRQTAPQKKVPVGPDAGRGGQGI